MAKEKLDFGKGKISRLFGALFFPTFVGMVFNSILNMCDGMFVGHGVGSDALAAVNIVAPLFLICAGIGLMFGIGSSVIGSIRLAEGNEQAARTVMTQAHLAGAVIFGIVIMVSLIWTKPVLYALGCSVILEDYASDYLLWLLPGLVFFYVQCVGMMLIRLDGSPRYAMNVQIVAAVINIFLDWLLVFPLNMGIKGAAIATAISCIVAGVMVEVYFIRYSNKLRFVKLRCSMQAIAAGLRSSAYMAKIGFATFLSELAIGITMVTGNFVFMKYMGEAGVAAFSVGCYLFPVIFSMSNAVAQSAQPIISYNYGAGQMVRVRTTLRLALITAAVAGVAVCFGMWGGAPLFSSIFLPKDTPAYAIAADGLPLLGICAVFFAANITFIGYCQSTEQAARSTIYTLLRGLLFLVPGFIVLPHLLGESGLWLAIPAAELLTLAVIVATFRVSAVSRQV